MKNDKVLLCPMMICLLLLIFMVAVPHAWAQKRLPTSGIYHAVQARKDSIVVRGCAIDTLTMQPLQRIHVYLYYGKLTCTTDVAGTFHFSLPLGAADHWSKIGASALDAPMATNMSFFPKDILLTDTMQDITLYAYPRYEHPPMHTLRTTIITHTKQLLI